MDDLIKRQFNPLNASILLVDDDENILNSLNRLLRTEGYRIRMANSGAEGLELLEKSPADLILCDMRMPGMDGSEFLRQVAPLWPDTMNILITGYADLPSTIKAINEGGIHKYISKPWENNDLKLQVKHALEKKFLLQEQRRLQLLTEQQNMQLKEFNDMLEFKVKERTAELIRVIGLYAKTNESLKKNYTATVQVFTNLLGLRQNTIGRHSRRIATHAMRLAKTFGLSDEAVQQVLFASLLHDIGKISLPDNLISKPFGNLTQQERLKVCKHPTIGESLLMAIEPFQEAARIVGAHHEYFDGSGYPAGLSGKAIPVGARILTVVNEYDSFQFGNLGDKREKREKAIEYLKKNRGTLFDPEIVDAFILQLEQDNKRLNKTASVQISDSELKEGMVLANDLITEEGLMLLTKDQKLDSSLVNMLKNYHRHTGEKLKILVKTNEEIKCIESC